MPTAICNGIYRSALRHRKWSVYLPGAIGESRRCQTTNAIAAASSFGRAKSGFQCNNLKSTADFSSGATVHSDSVTY
jgi:hypothetical protein